MYLPVGLDINGWRDYACRDWSAEDPGAPAGEPIMLEGGIQSVIVEQGDLLVGGPQAILSPIGRGQGWSDIGDASKRRNLADHWSDLRTGTTGPLFDRDMHAAVQALSLLADQRIVCIPDHAGMGEAQQRRLLGALSRPREPRTVLLWRPVAVVLSLLESDGLPNPTDGMRIMCLIHGPDGIERQHLVLRRLADHPDKLAPERAGAGDVCLPSLGLRRLIERGAVAVLAANQVLRDTRTDQPRMASDLLFAESPQGDEIVRRANGNWLKLSAPPDFALLELADSIAELSVEGDCVVLLSPLAARYRAMLAEGLAARWSSGSVVIVNPDSAARGALFAARRIERGIPHYLDHLEQISLIAMRGDQPTFEDLIPTNATVPGNREYVSAPITSMVWTAGMDEVQFYIRKGPHEIRRWLTSASSAPEKNERLEIHLRQMPAQGWATLSVTSNDWDALRRAPIVLDWGSLEVDQRTEAEIFLTLQRARPAVPERARYGPHIGLWDGSLRGPGLLRRIAEFLRGDRNGLAALAAAVSSAYFRSAAAPGGPIGPVYPIGTDGDLPAELDDAARLQFVTVVDRVSLALLRSLKQQAYPLESNDALRFLTWIFAACPHAVQEEVVAAFEAVLSGQQHGLLAPLRAKTVILHGVGRIVTNSELLRRLVPKMCARLPDTAVLAPLGSLLSRPLATPEILAEMDLEAVADAVRAVLQTQRTVATFGTHYKYALMILAGLLRVREHDPWALTSERSQMARAIAGELRLASDRLQTRSATIRAVAQKQTITLTLIEYLETNEGRPDILTVIDRIED